ncbi:GNAT family N-acetyltransferase [Gracilibacillus alcaliphilus]|uniref:GNAT family N-acetyltransferase n=1 Tax=Gracilibacillus alcaliphilus TaxID=1401441 RepID=UPI001958517E|nr:GNAT family N-acetyltransferase [Gracilibacillus alcaliphilus]MBM7677882.1 RimJ/RimL family protein N-acetyltransferase [Gracilibacillus alcaliphilus]
MIIELEKSDFYKCTEMVVSESHLEVPAVIYGNNPGRIFVDNKQSPRSGMIWLGNMDGFIFIGEADNLLFNREIKTYMDEVIAPEAIKLGLGDFEGSGHTPEWDQTITEIFEKETLISSGQRVYKLPEENFDQQTVPEISEDYSIVKVTSDIDQSNFKNKELLLHPLQEFWESPADCFAKGGIVYMAMKEAEIAAVIYTGFSYQNKHLIGIETDEQHQGRKLAQRLTYSYVQEALAKGIIMYWDVMEVNSPSIAVAEKSGFQRLFNYKVYEYSFVK